MDRKLKMLGLALLTVLVGGGVWVVGAQAFTNEDVHITLPVEEATVTGQQKEKHPVFHMSLGRLTCNIALDGTVKDGATQITVTPTYEDCTTSTGLFVTFTHEG